MIGCICTTKWADRIVNDVNRSEFESDQNTEVFTWIIPMMN